MDTRTGEIRCLDETESPRPHEVRLTIGQVVRIGAGWFELVAVDVAAGNVLLHAIPAPKGGNRAERRQAAREQRRAARRAAA